MINVDVQCICPTCGTQLTLSKRTYQARIRLNIQGCRKCMYGEKIRQKLSNSTRKLWQQDDYRSNQLVHINKPENILKRINGTQLVISNVSDGVNRYYNNLNNAQKQERKNAAKIRFDNLSQLSKDEIIRRGCDTLSNLTPKQRQKQRENSYKSTTTDEYKKKMTNISNSKVNADFKKKISMGVSLAWKDPIKAARMLIRLPYTDEMRQAASNRMKELWSSGVYRDKWLSSMEQRSNNHNQISTQQKILYRILEDLQLTFKKEPDNIRDLSFGSYRCDAMILPINKKPIIVFVHGDYFHRFVKARVEKDKQFMEYYGCELAKDYGLLILWEHEFIARNRIRDKVIKLTGPANQVAINKKDLSIEIINKDTANEFFRAYHYLAKGGRGICIGVKYGDVLVGAASFAHITRIETAKRLDRQPYEVIELDRFCLHPGFISHNLASWFLSRATITIEAQQPHVKIIVSFADVSFDHSGTIYKAAGWINDGVADETYWYIDVEGHVLHKRTLYRHAKSIRMVESEFADKFGYKRVWTGKKLRFIKVINHG